MTSLPRLDADLVSQPPDPDLLDASCAACGKERCTPVATVSVPDGLVLGDAAAEVGLLCLPYAVERANAVNNSSRPTVVDYPVWAAPDIIVDAGLSRRRVDCWVRMGLIVPLDGASPGYGHPHRFLAPEVEHARWLGRCSRAGLNLQRAHELLVGSDADRAMAQAFHARFATRGAVAA